MKYESDHSKARAGKTLIMTRVLSILSDKSSTFLFITLSRIKISFGLIYIKSHLYLNNVGIKILLDISLFQTNPNNFGLFSFKSGMSTKS